MAIAGRAFKVRLSRAASYGDVWLIDEATGIVAAGDLITLPAPFLDTACPERWTAALDELVAVPFTQVVPGHGPVLNRAGVERYRDMAHALRACAASDRSAEDCGAEWIAGAGPFIAERDRAYVAGGMTHYVGLLRNADSVARMCAGEVG
jgi:glyoxylase-like metal-dependent hydrolase (beta-lactamase superfamily II)